MKLVKPASLLIAGILAAFSAPALAGADKDAVKAVIKAVKQGQDLAAVFPGAISSREVASLQRVSKCSAVNLMKQPAGHYTVVWDCGSKGALGMRVEVAGGMVKSISTMAIGAAPNTH